MNHRKAFESGKSGDDPQTNWFSGDRTIHCLASLSNPIDCLNGATFSPLGEIPEVRNVIAIKFIIIDQIRLKMK